MTIPDLGMPVLIELENLGTCAELCHDLGLQFIELNMNMPQYQIDRFHPEEALNYQDAYGIYYTLHLDEGFNPYDFNPFVSRAYFDTVRWALELAVRLHMPVVNMHMAEGIRVTLPDERIYLYERFHREYKRKIVELRRICEHFGVLVCVENCDGYPEFARQAIDYLLESPVFALTLDIGHSHTAGGVDEAFITGRMHKLAHMHIHDACGTQNHLAVGEGEIDVRAKLDLARRQNCRCVVETKTVAGLKKSVTAIREICRSQETSDTE